MSNKPKIEKTEDGSNTLVDPLFGTNYHSKFGAVEESNIIFIKSGLQQILSVFSGEINILEMGFGTGLNAFNTLLKTQDLNREINYTGVEKYPVDASLVSELDYADALGYPEKKSTFLKIHEANWEIPVKIMPNFTLKKVKSDFQDFQVLEPNHIIYFDAFDPNLQPELWTPKIFKPLYDSLAINGIMVSYCVKGIVKRGLREVGFRVKRFPGPTGKRHILVAYKES